MYAKLAYTRAVLIFILAYVLVTILAVGLAYALAEFIPAPPTVEGVNSPAYLLAEKFYPLINLMVWIPLSWLYFKTRDETYEIFKEALTLGTFWLILAMLIDLVGFVLIKHPLSLSPRDFYIGQFPWIYLIYAAIFISPICCAAMIVKRKRLIAQ
ncbi:MAG: hypothetical protein H7070_11340 [Saprospiraceae bacterium]|nr:hypothetical protein [Pyrinomonadaceae bacterium]